jgi:hypothetical protein
VQSKEQKLNKPHRYERYNVEIDSQCRSSQKTDRFPLKTQIDTDNTEKNTDKAPDDSNDPE